MRDADNASVGSPGLPDLSTMLSAIVRQAAGLVGAGMGGLYLVGPDGDGLELAVSHNLPNGCAGTKLGSGEGLAGRVAEAGESMMIEDCRQWEGTSAFCGEGSFRRALGVPLKVGDRVIGVMHVADDERTGLFEENEVQLVNLFAEQASLVLANAQLFRIVERAKRDWEETFDAMQDPVVLVDPEYRVLRANRAFADLVQMSFLQFVGQSYQSVMDGARCPESLCPLDQAVRDRQSATCVHEYGERVFEIQATAVSGTVAEDSVEAEHSIYFMRDITEQRRAEQEIERRNLELVLLNRIIITREVELERQAQQAQKMEALGRLAGGIAHDFNNLLTVIHLSTRLLERELQPEKALLSHVRQIREAGERAASLTKQLLSFSCREVIEPQVVCLNDVVSELSQMLQRIIGEDVELAIDLAEDLWPVKVDPAQTEQVLMNLVINSRDAMPDGGTLTLKTKNVRLDEAYVASHMDAQPGDHVLLTVSDTGQGMNGEVKSRLFEPFFTTKEQGQGTGLGLSTVFGIVRRSGGHIRVESYEGAGASFEIFFPRDGGIEFEAAAPFLRPEVAASEWATETVLVVEDDVGVRHLAVHVLTSYGYEVLEAEDGAEAMQISDQYKRPIHLLLTDVVMPQMNGRDLADCLRGQRPGTPVLYMSGYADNAIRQLGTLPPDTDFLPKPFSVEDLILKVRSLTARK